MHVPHIECNINDFGCKPAEGTSLRHQPEGEKSPKGEMA